MFRKFCAILLAASLMVSAAGCSTSPATENGTNPATESSTSSVTEGSTSPATESEAKLTPGTYSVEGVGAYGDFSIDVTVDETKIQSVDITETHDSLYLGQRAQTNVAENVVQYQSTEVDGLTGATISTTSMKKAVRTALAEAGATDDMFNEDHKSASNITVAGAIADFEADVIVVGVGISGLTAALTAADSCAKVLMIEQNSYFGGSTMFSGGYIAAAGSTTLDELGYETDPERFAEWLGSGDTSTFRPDLARVVGINSGKALDMLTKYGAEWELGGNIGLAAGAHQSGQSSQEINNDPDNFAAYVIAKGSRGLGIFETTAASVQELVDEGQMAHLLDTKVVDLITDESGSVIGVETKDGAKYYADATILCAGGYSNNKEMMEKLYTRYALASAETSDGSMIPAGEKVGAAFHDMDTTRIDGGTLPVYEANGVPVYREVANKTPGVVWLNSDGERFIKEAGSSVANAYRTAENNTIYIVMNQELVDAAPVLYYGNYATFVMDETNEELNRLVEEGKVVVKADTIEEAATKMGLDPASVAAELEKYNSFCEAGVDEDFEKDPSALISLAEGPYYIFETIPNIKTTNGGMVIDTEGRVLNEESAAIKGLYAAGETAGNVDMANPKVSYYGANLHRGATIGYVAALTAVKDFK